MNEIADTYHVSYISFKKTFKKTFKGATEPYFMRLYRLYGK